MDRILLFKSFFMAGAECFSQLCDPGESLNLYAIPLAEELARPQGQTSGVHSSVAVQSLLVVAL